MTLARPFGQLGLANPLDQPGSSLEIAVRAAAGGAAAPVLSGTLPNPTNAVAYNQSLTTTGGQAPLVYDISLGALPAGLSINSSTGAITGTPTGFGDATFTVRVTDALSQVGTSAQAITVYGPELVPAWDNAWSFSLQGGAAGTVTQDATGITFAAANNIATAFHATSGLVDNATYEITFTLTNTTGGGFKILAYAATTAHSAQTSPNRSADGTYTQRVVASSAGSFTQRITIQATGANGTNSAKITFVSVKQVG